MTGTVKWFSPAKGYGFVTGEDGNDYFVHYSQIQAEGFKTLNSDQKVSFEVGEGKDGKPQCMNVNVA